MNVTSWASQVVSRLRRRPKTPAGHTIFERFSAYDGWAEPGFERGFYGTNTRDWLYTGESKGLADRRRVVAPHPGVDEEYFEWIALMSVIATARDGVCFAEIGAGWGRWMVAA